MYNIYIYIMISTINPMVKLLVNQLGERSGAPPISGKTRIFLFSWCINPWTN